MGNVSRIYKVNNVNLGSWVYLQGCYYRKNKIILTKDKIKMLENLNFNFNRYDSTWAEMFEELIELKNETGKFSITRKKMQG